AGLGLASAVERATAAFVAARAEAWPMARNLLEGLAEGALSLVLEEARLEALNAALRAAGDWPGVRRIAELRRPSTDHSWIRGLHAARGPVLSAAEYVDSLALRLGVPLVPEGAECSLRGEIVDRCGVRPQTRAPGAATWGHYRARHRAHLLVALGYTEAAPEPLGLAALG
ncbi:unnamed protein product, partial [Prorocentrum cordatum]